MEYRARLLSKKLKEEFLKAGLADDAVLNNRINAIIDELSDYQVEMEYLNRELVQNSNTVVIRWKTDGTIISFNEYASHFFGYTSEEIIGKPINIIVPQTDSKGIDLSELVNDIATRPEQFVRVINENICSDGRLVWLAWTNKAIFDREGKVSEILAVGIDITDIKKAEADLQQSEQRFITLFRSNPTPSGITRATDYRIVDVNDAWCKMTGYSREEAIGHNAVELGLAKPETLDKVRSLIQTGNEIQQTEIQLFTRTGEERHVLINSELIEMGGEKYMLNNLLDITARKQSEKLLAENENRYRRLFENMNSGVAVYKVVNDGEDFIFSDFNSAGEKIDGDKREDLVGRSIFEMRPGVKEFGLIEAMREVWKSGQPVFLPDTHYKDHRLDAWYENFIYRISSGEIVTVFNNISERRQTSENWAKWQNA